MMKREKLQNVVLCRLWTVHKNASPAGVAKSLFRFAASQMSEAEWRRVVDETIEAARAGGLVDKQSLHLTKEGRERVKRLVGGRPSSTKWDDFKRRDLPRVVTIADSKTNLTTHLLSEALACESAKNEIEVVDQFIVRSLGIRHGKVTLGTVRAALLAKQLGLPVRPRLAEVTRLAAVKLSGARTGSSDDVRDAMVSKYVRHDLKNDGNGTSNGTKSAMEERSDADDTFATKVLAAALSNRARRYGPTKAFIGSVWELLKSDAEIARLGEAGFKDRLVEAHRRGALNLSRADLVAAMDPADVRASETNHLGATYHFINTAGEQA
jgi:hypothetical protein